MEFKIIPNNKLDKSKNFLIYDFNSNVYEKEVVVSPCYNENWVTYEFSRLKLFFHQHNTRLIAFSAYNFFPLCSLFADRVILTNDYNPVWYGSAASTLQSTSNVDILSCKYFGEFYNNEKLLKLIKSVKKQISDNNTAIDYINTPICLLQNSYDKFYLLKEHYKKNLVIIEAMNNSAGRKLSQVIEKWGITNYIPQYRNRLFQNSLVNQTSKLHYLTFQILASHLLNWKYICYGGSSNLLPYLRIKCVTLIDTMVNQHKSLSYAMMQKLWGDSFLEEFIFISKTNFHNSIFHNEETLKKMIINTLKYFKHPIIIPKIFI